MSDRRTFLATAGLFLLGAGCSRRKAALKDPLLVNDVHSQLNPTRVEQIVAPGSLEELRSAIQVAAAQRRAVCIAGGRHAMGGQQFASGAVLVDTRKLARVLKLDGADRLCLGGALAANVHGRGLRMKPIIDDVESLTLVDAEGKTHHCSRKENPELFRLAIGGYGLFGVIYSLTLRLAPRRKLQRTVEIQEINGLRSVTYHRYATREQVEACYPQFRDFLWLKKQYDPEERFQSDWYRYYKGMLA